MMGVAWRAGRTACRMGLSLLCCPYGVETELGLVWCQGWLVELERRADR